MQSTALHAVRRRPEAAQGYTRPAIGNRALMIRPLVIVFASAAATLFALPADAQWKWRDKAGHTQYSDLPPPPDTAEQNILSRPSAAQRRAPTAPPAPTAAVSAAAPASAPLASKTVDPELEARRKKAEAEQAAKAKAEEQRFLAARAENCTRARQQLTTLESGIRLARANAQGEREFLDEKQRADETRRTREVIANDCK